MLTIPGVIVCAGHLVYRTIMLVDGSFTPSLGSTSWHCQQLFFRKSAHDPGSGRGNHRYAQTTWFHPRSKNPYQIDHFFVKQNDMKRVHDAKTVIWGADSDHRAIILRLDIGEAQRLYTDKPPMRVDRTVLHDPVKRKEFQQAVTKNILLLDNAHVDGVPATKLQVLCTKRDDCSS